MFPTCRSGWSGNRDDAADITQSGFLAAYEKLESYATAYRFFRWLCRIAVNQTLNFLARRRRFEPLDNDSRDAEKGTDAACVRDGAVNLTFIRTGLALVSLEGGLMRFFGLSLWTILDGDLVATGATAAVIGPPGHAASRRRSARFGRRLRVLPRRATSER